MPRPLLDIFPLYDEDAARGDHPDLRWRPRPVVAGGHGGQRIRGSRRIVGSRNGARPV